MQVLCTEHQSNMENGPVTLNLADEISTIHDRRGSCGGGGVDRIETQEKKTRFSLSHDEGTYIHTYFH